MGRRQTVSRQWLIIANGEDGRAIAMARCLPRGSALLLLEPLSRSEMRQLRFLARHRDLTIVRGNRRNSARVHDLRELRDAMLRRTPLIFVSPLHPTRTHPSWQPLGRMRAAALARIGGRRVIALGGMNEKRFARVAQLGFVGWAGISAWSEPSGSRKWRA